MSIQESHRLSYRSAGFLVVPEALSSAELADIRGAAEAACDAVAQRRDQIPRPDNPAATPRVSGPIPELGVSVAELEGEHLDIVRLIEPVTQVDGRLEKLWDHPTLQQLASMALETDSVVPFTSKLNTKRAKSGGEFYWHQDYPYWYTILRKEAERTVSVMVLLDEAREDNGCLSVLPGSHTGPFPRKKNVSEPSQRYLADESLIDDSKSVPALGPAGSFVLFGPYILHRSGANTSTNDRRGLILTYQAAGSEARGDSPYHEEWLEELP